MAIDEACYIPYHTVPALGPGPALVFAPHPDDEVFGCAGALLQHVAAGDTVKVIIVTDGAFGGDGHAYVQSRQQESREAARVLGYGQPIFWGWPDRGLELAEPLIRQIQEAIAAFAPALVYAPSWWEIHPDHVALSRAVTEALRQMENPPVLVLYEVGAPLHPNCLLDITEWIPQKKAAIACFGSQLQQQAYDDHILALNRYRTYTLPSAVKAAEAYRRVEGRGGLPVLESESWMSRRDSPAVPRVDYPEPQGGRAPQRISRWGHLWKRLAKGLRLGGDIR